jgi:hypothetical protein
MNKEPGAPGAHTCRACGADAAACALDAALAGQRRWLCRACEQAAARAGQGVCLRCVERGRLAGVRWCYSCARSPPNASPPARDAALGSN